MHKPEDYKALLRWNQQLSSNPHWNLDLAVKEQAPLDALYRKHDSQGDTGQWVCVSDLHDGHDFRVWYEEQVLGQPKRPRRRMRTLTVRLDLPPGDDTDLSEPQADFLDALALPDDTNIISVSWQKP